MLWRKNACRDEECGLLGRLRSSETESTRISWDTHMSVTLRIVADTSARDGGARRSRYTPKLDDLNGGYSGKTARPGSAPAPDVLMLPITSCLSHVHAASGAHMPLTCRSDPDPAVNV
jgi:hypothetical protein